MGDWTRFPFDPSAYERDERGLRALWGRLHACDGESWPQDPALVTAWGHYHAGRFALAVEAGRRAGTAGLSVWCKAQCMYAHYLEPNESVKLRLFKEVAEVTSKCAAEDAATAAAASYWHAYANARLAQAVSVTEAYALGLAARIRRALEDTIERVPTHADAHAALGVLHAELIEKLGVRLAMAQGASVNACMASFTTALALNPASPAVRMEHAQAMLVIHGECEIDTVERLYEEAAQCEALDATERLQVESALSALAD